MGILKEKAEKDKAIKIMRDSIEKEYGKGTITTLKEKSDFDNADVISTGSIGLDLALGVGGLPKGRIVEIYGPESSGKTTTAIHIMAEAQKSGGLVGFIDVEQSFDKEYATNIGVNVDDLFISQPDYGEQALNIAEKMISSGAFDVIVIDSVAALVPKSEIDGEIGDNKMGLHARLMSQACRILAPLVSKNKTLLIFINQLREKIGVMFGPSETTPGGNALKFYASVRLDVRRSITNANLIKGENEEALGHPATIKIIKNKVGPPLRKVEFEIIFGKGINKDGEIIKIATDLDIIKKSGSWYSYKESKIGQGKEAVQQLLNDNEDLKKEILEEIYKKGKN